MHSIYLDFTQIFNRKMVFQNEEEAAQKAELLETGNYILSESFVFDKIFKKGNVRGVFRRNAEGFDNAACESQVLELRGIPVKRITFIGFCVWGYFKENFRLECADGSTEYAEAYFSDISCPLEEVQECCFALEKALYTDGCRYFKETKMKTGTGYIYYYPTEFRKTKRIEKIIFPENCLMHIFAITIEN